MTVKNLIPQFKAARRVGTPLVAIQTPDQFATVERLAAELNGEQPLIGWDVCRGFRAINELGKKAMAQFVSQPEDQSPVTAMIQAQSAPTKTVLFIHNAQRWVGDAQTAQGVANLRDAFKVDFRTLVLLAPTLDLPAELQSDVVVLDEPLPEADELRQIVKDLHESAGKKPVAEVLDKAVVAVQGLSAFAAEQVTAMSFTKDGLDTDALWERKRKQIEQTPGLSVSRDGIKFDDLGGLPVIKEYLRDLLNGAEKPNAVVFIDEIEKMMGGQGDTSGVNQDQLGTILSYMQDNHAMGILLVGHPGSGKSAIAKATGNEAGVPTIQLDLGAAKGSLVGQSEQQLRTALKVVTSVSSGRTLWLATCNSLASLPPELRRRFKCGLFFFDLPSEDERKAIWKVHRKRFNIQAKDKTPDDAGWTGAEIEQCCELAYRLNRPLDHAAKFVVPISQSAADRIEALRLQADGRWLNASAYGTYQKEDKAVVPATGKRKLNLE